MAEMQCCLLLAARAVTLAHQAKEQIQPYRWDKPNPDWSDETYDTSWRG